MARRRLSCVTSRMSWPSISIAPAGAAYKRENRRSDLDLAAPLRPSIALRPPGRRAQRTIPRPARGAPIRPQDHVPDQAAGDNCPLADIEQRQRRLASDGGAFIGVQGPVVALRLVGLVGEIFARLVVQQAVDRLGVGLAVALVHF